jgi:hypothetical protein
MGMSRRPQQPPTAVETLLPLHQRAAKRKVGDANFLPPPGVAASVNAETPPRSGQFNLAAALMENLDFLGGGSNNNNNHDKKPPTKRHAHSPKRKFQVEIPSRLLIILAMVFLIAPILIFLHKEAHIHEDHDRAHYKAEKFVNVDTDAVLSQFRANATSARSGSESGDASSHDTNSTVHFVETRGEEKGTGNVGDNMLHVDMLMEQNPKAVNATNNSIHNQTAVAQAMDSTHTSGDDENSSGHQVKSNTTDTTTDMNEKV